MQLEDIWRAANLLVLKVLGIQQHTAWTSQASVWTHMTAFSPHSNAQSQRRNISKLAAFLGTNHSLALLHVLRDSFGIKREKFC